MKTTIPKLRKMIRKVIVESMSQSDPDYDTVGEVISQITRSIMHGHIPADEEAVEMECQDRAREYGVSQHVGYIIEKCMAIASQFAPEDDGDDDDPWGFVYTGP